MGMKMKEENPTIHGLIYRKKFLVSYFCNEDTFLPLITQGPPSELMDKAGAGRFKAIRLHRPVLRQVT
jgi:hypothetical protein